VNLSTLRLEEGVIFGPLNRENQDFIIEDLQIPQVAPNESFRIEVPVLASV
jgi:hypothetical protein